MECVDRRCGENSARHVGINPIFVSEVTPIELDFLGLLAYPTMATCLMRPGDCTVKLTQSDHMLVVESLVNQLVNLV